MNLFNLSGGVAFVTGAGSGIGQRLALGFAEAGADVGCFDVNRTLAEQTADMIRALDRKAAATSGDVRDPQAVTEAVEATVQGLGPLTIALNNAGVVGKQKAEEMTLEEWRRVVDINLTGVFLCAQAEARTMIESGGGSIINIASMSATIVNRDQYQAHYNASKAGVKHLTKSLAAEWAPRGVRVNAISPGYILTPLTKGEELGHMHAQWEDATPLGRIGRTDDLVGPAIFFASQAGAFTTGADLIVDGGYVIW
ncbi:MAG: short chain dehydrogenase [Gordonia sp. (in: high G+C Gram-positive bacteria)]|nr:MAG: short chain dehydrogenase [Gordonia sp. (in: high G+C Gram-positive bacteria)]